MDRGDWRGVVHRVAKSRTQLNNLACTQVFVVVFQLLSHVQLFATQGLQHTQESLSFAISQSFLKPKSTESVMPSNHRPLLSPSPPAFNLS